MMDNQQAKTLLKKYRQGVCTDAEKALVESWYLSTDYIEEKVSHDEIEAAMHEVRQNLPMPDIHRRNLWPRVAAAAAIIIMIGAGLFYYKQSTIKSQNQIVKGDVLSGGNKAILTLASGKKVSLTDATNGIIAKESGISITKNSDGLVSYERSPKDDQIGKLVYNTIETPKGGQYKIHLPDGTNVWLNAATKLKYPTSFASLKSRQIELSGEAYFEVAKDKEHPFLVSTSNQTVEVLGTHFNINAYESDKSVKTTLLEGAVKVLNHRGDEKILKPGQQSILQADILKVNDVETDYEVAWKEGYFMFNNESLESIMNKVARWYNVDVVFLDPTLKSKSFIGTISRFGNISKVLNMLERTDVATFQIDDGKIIVNRKSK